MDRDQAYEESRRNPPGSRSLRCIWYCGKINEEIRKAARLGETSLELRFALCGFAPGDIQRDLSEPGIRCELCAEFSVYPAYRVDLYPQLETGNKIKKA